MRFVWDEQKRIANRRKHGVDFADAIGALLDECSRTIEDADAQGEERFLTLGRGYCDRILLVVWAERDGDCIRIISARKASPGEARHYEG